MRSTSRLWITLAALLAAVLPAAAQYPGQITKPDDHTPTLRAIAVFEWTGDEAKPKTSRLVPICIYDGHDLQDADIYLARPSPLALTSDVEYQLLQNGKPLGLFDIETAAREQGSWVGYGKRLPLPVPKPAPKQVARIDEYDDAQSDTPVLHRKHHAGDAGSGSGGSSGNSTNDSGPDPNAPPPDPDRPTLHKKGGDTSGSSTGDASNSGSGSTPVSDSGRPELHRLPDSSAPETTSTNGSNQPKLKRKKNEEDEGYVTSVDKSSDPNRPHLFRGKSAGFDGPVIPSLLGLPSDLHQEVAVSDQTDRPVHVWDYVWANPDDEAKMKAAMEDIARTALGLNPPPAPAKPAPKTKTAATAHKPKQPTLPPQPAPLVDEQFRVFELAYGSGATMVLSAHTDGTAAEEKFVTLVAQPDLYGNVAVLIKNVTDAAHLDDTPRMRLVDAVDALADNRGDLLFELRGSTQRQFALYRVLRGDATRIFLSSVDSIAAPTGQ
ncbi:MAG: hypothetical protein P4K93_07320 [Terracidiphilus sp.]|nr:hypothetical protein [Terracidiphilus sp.]MDR3797945.1 hypothetical protein [Terracidiphilus sp.]